MIPVDWVAVGPALIVAVGAITALLVDACMSRRSWMGPASVSTVASVAATGELIRTQSLDPYTLGLSIVLVLGLIMVIGTGALMDHEDDMPPGEFHFLLLSSAAGGLAMVTSRDLVTLIVSLELLALPSIALVGLRRSDRRAMVSAWTFFITSVVATTLTLMGMSLLYGIAGSLRYEDIDKALRTTELPAAVVSVAVAMTLVALLFKIGAVPFHVWIPDAYSGASVAVAGYLSVVSKTAALGAIITFVSVALPSAYRDWVPLLAIVAGVTMTLGNIAALRSSDAVGLLAWSSIAQAGFIIAPVIAVSESEGLSAPLRYFAVYAAANLTAFLAVAMVRRRDGRETSPLADFRGLARRDPVAGIGLAFALLTLAGFPPAVIGLLTKYIVLRPVLEAGHEVLAVVMALNVAIGLVFYLRFLVLLFEPVDPEAPAVSPSPPYATRLARLGVALGTAGLVALSIYPDLLLTHLPPSR